VGSRAGGWRDHPGALVGRSWPPPRSHPGESGSSGPAGSAGGCDHTAAVGAGVPAVRVWWMGIGRSSGPRPTRARRGCAHDGERVICALRSEQPATATGRTAVRVAPHRQARRGPRLRRAVRVVRALRSLARGGSARRMGQRSRGSRAARVTSLWERRPSNVSFRTTRLVTVGGLSRSFNRLDVFATHGALTEVGHGAWHLQGPRQRHPHHRTPRSVAAIHRRRLPESRPVRSHGRRG